VIRIVTLSDGGYGVKLNSSALIPVPPGIRLTSATGTQGAA
jgi:hypothetical protein